MTPRSRWLDNEERLALFCSLIVTGVLTAFLQQLKEVNDEGGGLGTLVEYRELAAPGTQRRVLRSAGPARSKEKPPEVRVDMNVAPSVDTARLEHAGGSLRSSSTLPRDPGPRDSVVAHQSLVFRVYQPDVVVDSIFRADSTLRLALLRQHLRYSSSIYDTVTALQLIHLSTVIRRFDEQPVTLEESTWRDIRRYGHPYDPTRPQPLSPQIPLGGVLSRLLNYIF